MLSLLVTWKASWSNTQPVNYLSVTQSVNTNECQSVDKSDGQSISPPVGQSVHQSFNQYWVSQSVKVNHLLIQLVNWLYKWLKSQSINQSINWSDRVVYWLTSQTDRKSISQSVRQDSQWIFQSIIWTA